MSLYDFLEKPCVQRDHYLIMIKGLIELIPINLTINKYKKIIQLIKNLNDGPLLKELLFNYFNNNHIETKIYDSIWNETKSISTSAPIYSLKKRIKKECIKINKVDLYKSWKSIYNDDFKLANGIIDNNILKKHIVNLLNKLYINENMIFKFENQRFYLNNQQLSKKEVVQYINQKYDEINEYFIMYSDYNLNYNSDNSDSKNKEYDCSTNNGYLNIIYELTHT